jgi:hypothetical protein
MKRLGLLILIAAVAAGGIVYKVHQSGSTTSVNVATLLPRETVALVHVPDFNQSRDDWHQTDIYKLSQEPSVREFLNKPLSRVPQRDTTSQTLAEIEQLALKDAFVAVTSIEDNSPHFAAGFRFRGSQSNAEKIIERWRSQLVHDPSVHETVDYEQHKIDIAGAAPNQIAYVYDGQWFLASNDLVELKAVLDRADERTKDPQNTLEANEAFRAAMAHMPRNYAVLFYVQPKGISEKLTKVREAISASGSSTKIVDQIHSVCGATRFENGRMRDVLFVGMPKTQSELDLTRSSLDLSTPETFLYLATLLNPDRLAEINQGGLPTGTWLQKLVDSTARAGVTVDDWKTAFDMELASLADWPQSSHWPSIIAMLRVRDFVHAGKLVNTLTQAIDVNAIWSKTERDGVTYFYMQTPAALLAITPTIALSNQMIIMGLDSVSVESAIKRPVSQRSSRLTSSPVYKTAVRAVPTPTAAFVYIDTPLLYSRLDAALRPMLLMSAAFMPAISDYVDVGKLPQPEIVAKHLSPIVSSQRYDADGYVTESVGPITLSEAAVGIALPAIFFGKPGKFGR